MKSPEEVEKLKRDWIEDPCYDIEEAEGFEDHYEELISFRLAFEEDKYRNCGAEMIRHAELTGIGVNLRLAEYIMGPERRIDQLEERIGKLLD